MHMSEWNPSIVKIEKITMHPNANALSIATVLGDYPIIIKLGQFEINQLVSYIPIDSILDIDRPEFNFLDKPRIKAKRLRGVYSQGLLIEAPEGFKEGDSVVDYFGIKKHVYPEEMEDILGMSEEERKKYCLPKIDAQLLAKTRGGNAESPPRGWSPPYYDLEALRKYYKAFEENEEVVLMEKLDGSNSFYRHDGERLWTKSHNLFKKRPDNPEGCMWWEIAIRNNFEEKLAKYPQLGIYGECYGNVNPYMYDCPLVDGKVQKKFRMFDIFDFSASKFIDYDDMVNISNDLEIEMAPTIYKGPWLIDKSLYALAEQNSFLKSNIPGATNIMEGFVIRPIKERIDQRSGQRIILKLKSERYNLSKK